MPYNFAAESFHKRNFVADFLRENPNFVYGKRKMLPLGVTGNVSYDVPLRLIEKLVGDFLLVIIELFFARCFRFVTMHAFDRQTDGRTDGQTDRCRQQDRAYASQSHGKNGICYPIHAEIFRQILTVGNIIYEQ